MRVYAVQEFDYPRATTDAWIRFRLANGELWEFPAQVVADNRDRNYADEQEDTIGFIREGSLDADILTEWAVNNMNWSDVKPYARRVEEQRTVTDRDFQEAWMSAEKTIHGEV